MLLIYVQKTTPRISYIFKHICLRILGFDVVFTSVIDEFIAHTGTKISYGKKPLGNELFFQSAGLLEQQGFETIDITVKKWDETVGFFAVSNASALPFDIFSASFYMISRYEEYLPHVKDSFGRFMATESLAHKEGFLQQPVVDIWAYKFKAVLANSFPDFEFPRKQITIHPVVEASRPFAYKQKGLFRTSVGYTQDLFKGKIRNVFDRSKVIMGFKRDAFDTFKWMMNTATRSKFKLTVFFLLGNARTFGESLNTHRQKFKMLVKYVNDYKEIGLIFSAASLTNYEMLKHEKRRMEEITKRSLNSSMNADYLVNLPDIYRNLIELEIKKDYTMVFRDTVGFRAGTCTPFLFFDLDFEIKTPLVIHPLAMTTYAFQTKYPSDIEKAVSAIYKTVENVNGTFSISFTNVDFSSTENNKIWRSIFSDKIQQYG